MGDTVVLSEFTNSTGDSAFDRLTPSVERSESDDALSDRNVSSPSVKFLSSDQVTKMLLQMNHKSGEEAAERVRRRLDEPLTPGLARELCLPAKANAFVMGSVSAAGAHYKITATAIDCQTGETLGTAEGEAEKLVGARTDVRRASVSRAMGDVVDQLLQKVLKSGGAQAVPHLRNRLWELTPSPPSLPDGSFDRRRGKDQFRSRKADFSQTPESITEVQ